MAETLTPTPNAQPTPNEQASEAANPAPFDPSDGNPFVSKAGDIARQSFVQEQPAQPTPAVRNERPKVTPGQVLTGAAIVGGLVVAGVATGAAIEASGGNNTPDRGVEDSSIESITLNPDATLRLDPKVGDSVLGPNDVLHLGAAITIDVNHDIRVLEGTNNGTWYGIDMEAVRAAVPDLNDHSDNDGVLWVNEQGIKSIDRTDLPTIRASGNSEGGSTSNNAPDSGASAVSFDPQPEDSTPGYHTEKALYVENADSTPNPTPGRWVPMSELSPSQREQLNRTKEPHMVEVRDTIPSIELSD